MVIREQSRRSLYGSVGNAATAYGIPYIHSENGAHTQGVFSGNVDSVAPAFGHGVFSGHVDGIATAFGGAQTRRSAHLANAAPTNEDSTISLQANLSGWFTQNKNQLSDNGFNHRPFYFSLNIYNVVPSCFELLKLIVVSVI